MDAKLSSAADLLRTFVLPVLGCIQLSFAACSVSDAPLEPDEASAETGEDDEAECRDEGSMRSCSCGSGADGVKTCTSGRYGSCKCDEDERVEDDTDAVDAGRVPRTPACKAGYYVGEFSGSYRPGLFGFGVLGSGIPFDIAGGAMGARPALAFTLEENAIGPAGEFSTFTVGNGCMTGVAKAVGTDNPFVAKLTGDLDCETGELVGELEGYYTLLNFPGANFKFRGPFKGKFDREQSRLRDGTWSVMEPPALNGDPAGGGDGTWSAIYEAAKAPAGADDPCRDIVTSGASDGGAAGADAGADAGA